MIKQKFNVTIISGIGIDPSKIEKFILEGIANYGDVDSEIRVDEITPRDKTV